MQDNKVSSAAVLSWALWGVTGGIAMTAWSFWIAGHWHAAVMLGLLSCVMSAAAATAQVRHYTIRVCSLIRRLYDMEPPPERRTGSTGHDVLRMPGQR